MRDGRYVSRRPRAARSAAGYQTVTGIGTSVVAMRFDFTLPVGLLGDALR